MSCVIGERGRSGESGLTLDFGAPYNFADGPSAQFAPRHPKALAVASGALAGRLLEAPTRMHR